VHVDATNQKVLGYLGRALSLELSAVQLYSTQARLVAHWGLEKAAERLRHECREEMQHVDRVIARMLAKGAVPNASQLRPVSLGPDLLSLLKINRQFEMELVSLYQDAVNHCRQSQDTNDEVFFQELLEEEQDHAADLSAWIAGIEEKISVAATYGENRVVAQSANRRSRIVR
jgi:bacterioferritin